MQAGDNPYSFGNNSDDDVARDEPVFPSIPKELEYLIEPGIHYGRKYQFDDAVQRFLENAEESEFETLATLAERARLSGDYTRLLRWMDEVDDACERIVNECHPYTVEVSEKQRKELLPLINVANDPPDIAERRRERCLRQFIEMDDHSNIAKLREKRRDQLLSKACNQTHYMDIYFLFGLLDACDMIFE